MEADRWYLPISGIQHFVFCKRQWALIHLERQWDENLLTVEGRHLHERVDDPFEKESRGDLLISRAVPLISHRWGVQGVADAIEFMQSPNNEGVLLPGRKGFWEPCLIEYKRGKEKEDFSDETQLCLQAFCLEEMMGIELTHGFLYYHRIRRRRRVKFESELRGTVKELASEMQALAHDGRTPPAERGKKCNNCSLREVCVPRLTKKPVKVGTYMEKVLKGGEACESF